MNSGARGERGAALMEVIIALAITALLAAAATQISGFGIAVIERGEASSTRAATTFAERRLLHDLFAHVAPGEAAFVGAPYLARWRGSVPGPDGLWRRGIWRYDATVGTLAPCPDFERVCAGDTRIAAGGARFDFADDSGDWRPDWPIGPAPALIRLRWPPEEADGTVREVIIAPRTGALR